MAKKTKLKVKAVMAPKEPKEETQRRKSPKAG
jgi:hypothetical protein